MPVKLSDDLQLVLRHADRMHKHLTEARKALYAHREDDFTKEKKQECWNHVDRAMATLEGLITWLSMKPVEIGRKGGTKTAERGPDYFRQIAAMRKTRAGGRPKKQPAPAKA